MQVVGYHHGPELPSRSTPAAGFQVSVLEENALDARQSATSLRVSIHCNHRVPARGKKKCMPATTASHIQNLGARPHEI